LYGIDSAPDDVKWMSITSEICVKIEIRPGFLEVSDETGDDATTATVE